MKRILPLFILVGCVFLSPWSYSQITVSFSVTNARCYGNPDGSVTATASAGLAPYAYAWSNGRFGPTLNNVPAGKYILTVTDAASQTKVDSVMVSQPAQVIPQFQVAQLCSVPTSVTVTGTGGVAPYTYKWDNESTSQVRNNLFPGRYCVTVVDANLCGAPKCITIEQPNPPSVSVLVKNLTCPGFNDGQLTANPVEGMPPYTYAWSSGGTTQTIGNLAPGTYSVTLTDAKGCQASATGTVTTPPPLNAQISATNPTCQGFTNGSATVTGSGGTPPLSYLWNTGQTTQLINNLGPGTYTVTITDSKGCFITRNVTLAPLSNLVAGALGTRETCPSANDGFATASPSGGVMPYTYAWSNGRTTQVLTNLAPGNYTVTVTDALGCTATATATVQASPVFDFSLTKTDITTCGAGNGSATVTALTGVPPFTYKWSNGPVTQGISGLEAGTYTVTVTNGDNCTKTASIIIIEPPLVFVNISASNTVCPGINSGTAAANVSGGTAPFAFLWNTGGTSQSIANLPAGTYSVTVTDSKGCQATASRVITQAPGVQVAITASNIVCGAGNTGNATAVVSSGVAPFSYSWNTGSTSATINNLPEGTYTVVVTDANGCKDTASTFIDVVDDLVLNLTARPVLCFGESNGGVSANPAGGKAPYTYLWSTGATTQDLTNRPAGVYNVTVTDANGCKVSGSAVVSQPTQLSAGITGNNNICPGTTTGQVTVTPAGGVQPYQYAWSNGGNTSSIGNLAAGTYTVTVSDANNCFITRSLTINQAPALNVSIDATEIVCGNGNKGNAKATASGGLPPYKYEWNTGSSTESVEGLDAGTYTVTATDANGCIATTEVEIKVINDFSLTLVPRNVLCNGGNTGSVLVNAQGGAAPYTFKWSNGANTNEIVNLPAGTYTVTVAESNGCQIVESVTITQPSALSATISATDIQCFGSNDGTASVVVAGGTEPYAYKWSNGMTTPQINNLAAGSHTLTITDSNLCEITASTTIREAVELKVTLSSKNILCAGTNTGSANVVASGGVSPYTYAWSNGGTTSTISSLIAGKYKITVTDSKGCTAVDSIVLTQPQALQIAFSKRDIVCTNALIGFADAGVSGGTTPYAYLWSNGRTTASIDNLGPGNYSLTVTDANNCQISGMLTIVQSTALQLTPTQQNITCFGQNDGMAAVAVAGGATPYQFLWSTGDTTSSISNKGPGVYSVTVTAGQGCTANVSVTLTQPTALNLTTSKSDVKCNGFSDGSASVQATGGTPPYKYLWNNGSVNASIGNMLAGTYSVTVTDANNCSQSTLVVVDQPQILQVTIGSQSNTCAGASVGMAVATATGGTGPYTYKWSNGQTGPAADALAGGSASVTVTDANGCSAQLGFSVASFPVLTCAVTVVQKVTNGNDGQMRADITGGSLPYTYKWSNGATTQVASGLSKGTYSVTATDANGCETVCSGVLDALSGIGDRVWEDFDRDGIQDPNETPVANITVKLKNASGTVIATTTTNADGKYRFMGLEPGVYSVMFVVPDTMNYSPRDAGNNDAVDSDAYRDTDGMTINTTLEPGEIDTTWDQGIYRRPTGVIGDPCSCLNNSTNEDNGQFNEMIEVRSYPNETWRIIFSQNMYFRSSPEPPAAPIPVPNGTELIEVKPGVYDYGFRLIDSFSYMVRVTNGFDTLSMNNVCFYPLINVEKLPPSDFCVVDDPITFSANPNKPGQLTFLFDSIPTTAIDPRFTELGPHELIVKFVPFDPKECIAEIITTVEITDNCLAMVGDKVWNDKDRDGIQDAGEPGIPNVKVVIEGVDEDDLPYMDTTYTDLQGMYMFNIRPGSFKITFCKPNDDFVPTTANAGGNDAADSDADPVMGMTGIITVAPSEKNFTVDAGYYSTVCDNVVDPGRIGYDQFLCGPGQDPAPFVSLSPAGGGVGQIEYLWMRSTKGGPFNMDFFEPIPNSNSLTYDAGPLYETTYFARCARREGCTGFLETNVLKIEIGNKAVAEILGPNLMCEAETATFYSTKSGQAAKISWDFGYAATPRYSSQEAVSVKFSSYGTYVIKLTVEENNCVSSKTHTVVVTNNPMTCGNGLVIDVQAMPDQQSMVTWRTQEDVFAYDYVVEFSADGVNFEEVATLSVPTARTGRFLDYSFTHASPKKGWNYYRVRVIDQAGDLSYSNIGKTVFYLESKLMHYYPNPVFDIMVLELFETFEEDITVDLTTSSGQVLRSLTLPAGTERIEIDLSPYSLGMYYLRVQYGEVAVKTLKVVKQQ